MRGFMGANNLLGIVHLCQNEPIGIVHKLCLQTGERIVLTKSRFTKSFLFYKKVNKKIFSYHRHPSFEEKISVNLILEKSHICFRHY